MKFWYYKHVLQHLPSVPNCLDHQWTKSHIHADLSDKWEKYSINVVGNMGAYFYWKLNLSLPNDCTFTSLPSLGKTYLPLNYLIDHAKSPNWRFLDFHSPMAIFTGPSVKIVSWSLSPWILVRQKLKAALLWHLSVNFS